MISYLINSYNKLLTALFQHIAIVVVTMLIAVCIAGIITLLMQNKKALPGMVITVLSVFYSIPSLALFALLISFTGLGRTTAVIVLVVYAQYILVRNFSMGLNEVDKGILEAAKGMGMSETEIFRKVQFPLAAGSFVAGIKLATTSTIGIATIAASINAGGLGTILFDGLRTLNIVKIFWGTILTVALCIPVNIGLNIVQKKLYIH
ncbi:MAG: ABC transporter permease [Catonella sp.]